MATLENRTLALADRWVLRVCHDGAEFGTAFHVDDRRVVKLNEAAYAIAAILETSTLASEDILGLAPDVRGVADRTRWQAALGELLDLGLLEYGAASHYEARRHWIEKPLVDAPVAVAATPQAVEVHLTSGCNLHCLHCARDAGRPDVSELSGYEWATVLGRLERLRVRLVTISGGEPLTHPEAASVLRSAGSLCMGFDVLTNGSLLDVATAEALASPNFRTTVSLDGATAATHDSLRGCACFNEVIEGIRLLGESGAAFGISCVLHRRNAHEVEAMVKLAADEGASFISFVGLDMIGRARDWVELKMSQVELDRVREWLRAVKPVIESQVVDLADTWLLEGSGGAGGAQEYVSCAAATQHMAIDSCGRMYPCTYVFGNAAWAAGNVRKDDIRDVWCSDTWRRLRCTRLEELVRCRECDLSSECSLRNCRLRPEVLDGDFLGAYPGCPRYDAGR